MSEERKINSTSKSPPIERIFLIGLGAAVVSYGMYELYKKMSGQEEPTSDTDIKVLQASVTSSKPKLVGNDRFPLKNGSKGSNVRLLQTGLQKILGADVMNKLTLVDGDFRGGTEKALVQAGFPIVVNEPTFLKIIQGNTDDTIASNNPRAIAEQLYSQVTSKNLNAVLMSLRQLKSISDYSLINTEYKKVTEAKTNTTYTIVTHLLNYSGFDGVSKEKIREEFRRIGLIEKPNGSWGLSGIKIFKDIQTLANTFVTEPSGMTILVDKGTILGEELKVSNGMTTFKALDGQVYQVPSRDVIQVR